MLKLNIGCGHNKIPGFVNIDCDPLFAPDIVADLETFPWPLEDNSVEYIFANHSLEHMGETTAKWLGIWKEIYRVCANGALIDVKVPHPRHENFVTDPTHCRVILPGTLAMFDQTRNIEDWKNGGQETKLGLMCGIDIQLVAAGYDLMEPWKSAVSEGKITNDDVQRDLLVLNNVCSQIIMQLKVIKPARGLEWMAVQKASVQPSAPVQP